MTFKSVGIIKSGWPFTWVLRSQDVYWFVDLFYELETWVMNNINMLYYHKKQTVKNIYRIYIKGGFSKQILI